MKSRIDRGDWIVILSGLAVFVAVALISNLEKAFFSGTSFCIFLTIILAKWDSRRDWRIWLILLVFACIHVAVIITVRFSEFRSGIVFYPFVVVDALLLWGLINWIEKRFPLRRH